jgi:vanillate O-demethylase monooxygenase subunit
VYPYREGQSFVRNAWYVAAWSDEIGRELMSRTILGEPVLLYRTEAGDAVAMSGLCAHRRFPLDQGTLVGDDVRCRYHGFTFGPDGRCVDIPTQPIVPDRCRVDAFPLVERWAWAWIWLGDPSRADVALIPDHDAIGLSADRCLVQAFMVPIGGRAAIINENLLDLTHIPYLHRPADDPGGEGFGGQLSAVTDEVSEDATGRRQRSVRTMDVAPERTLAPMRDLDEPVRFTLAADFYAPSFHAISLRYEERKPDGSAGRPLVHLGKYHAITPATESSCYYFFAQSRDFALDDAELSARQVAHDLAVIMEDKAAAELVEPLLDRPHRTPEFSCMADAGALRARRTIQRMLDAEVEGSPDRRLRVQR